MSVRWCRNTTDSPTIRVHLISCGMDSSTKAISIFLSGLSFIQSLIPHHATAFFLSLALSFLFFLSVLSPDLHFVPPSFEEQIGSGANDLFVHHASGRGCCRKQLRQANWSGLWFIPPKPYKGSTSSSPPPSLDSQVDSQAFVRLQHTYPDTHTHTHRYKNTHTHKQTQTRTDT